MIRDDRTDIMLENEKYKFDAITSRILKTVLHAISRY